MNREDIVGIPLNVVHNDAYKTFKNHMDYLLLVKKDNAEEVLEALEEQYEIEKKISNLSKLTEKTPSRISDLGG